MIDPDMLARERVLRQKRANGEAEIGPPGTRGVTINFATWRDRELPDRKWLVPGWLPIGHVATLYGDGGTGKSLLAQQLMTACAIGSCWLGLQTMHCPAYGVLCENSCDERATADDDR